MEDNKEVAKNKVKAKGKSGDERKPGRDIYLPASKDSWRRVFNETLKCYEVYVRKSNVLVATGIGNTGDSFLIGALPAIMDIYEKLLKEIENGEVKEETFRGAKYILSKFRENIRKSEAVGKSNLLRLDSPEFDLGGQGGGNHTEDGIFSE
jgi:hypothetical protein